jgi:hypothetical protein
MLIRPWVLPSVVVPSVVLLPVVVVVVLLPVLLLPVLLLLPVVHWVKSMAGFAQQVDSPVGACLWALVCGRLSVGAAAVGTAPGQEHGRV